MTALATVCRAISLTSRYEQRRYDRAMAWKYDRERHLEGVLGVWTETPFGAVEDTRRIIRRLGGLLHRQVMSSHPFRRRRIPWTRKALFGECLTLWHLQAERQAAE